MTMVTADCANSFIFAATGYMPVSLTLETSYREGEILSRFDPLIIYNWGIFMAFIRSTLVSNFNRNERVLPIFMKLYYDIEEDFYRC